MTTSPTDALARGLGLASLALGLPQVTAPDRVAAAVGARPTERAVELVRGVGLRELVAAAGLLLRGPASAPLWLWSRVAGDAMDLALLGRTLRSTSSRGRTWFAAAAVAGIGLVDLAAARRSSGGGSASSDLELDAAITVLKSPQEVYDFWRGLERLPSFMQHLEEVEWLDHGRTRWTAKAPVKGHVTWEAELVEDRPGEVIAWRSLPGADIDNSGSVRFAPAPGDRGTELRVHLRYSVPGGKAGALVARLLGEEPHQQVEDDLRRFKQVLETGQVVRSEGSPEGSSARRQLFQSPGQPGGDA